MREPTHKLDDGFRLLVYGFGAVWIMHMLAAVLHLTRRSCPPLFFERLFRFDAMFLNVPFSFSVALLFYIAVSAFTLGHRSRAKHVSLAGLAGWWMFGMGSLGIILVMVVGSRESADCLRFAARRFPLPLAGGIIVAIAMAILFIRFIWHLGPPARKRFLGAAALYLIGAVGFELLGEVYCGRQHEAGGAVIYAAVTTIEETCEMVGFLLAVRAVRLHKVAMDQRERSLPIRDTSA
jgi:hypothetical protein